MLKTLFWGFSFSFVFLAGAIFAAPVAPLLVKSQNAGYTMPQHFQSFTCNIFNDRIEIVRTFGQAASVTELRKITLTGNVGELITQAGAEEFTNANGTICDAPGTAIVANVPGTTGEASRLLLYAKSSCSQDGSRSGAKSTVLLNMANALCGAM